MSEVKSPFLMISWRHSQHQILEDIHDSTGCAPRGNRLVDLGKSVPSWIAAADQFPSSNKINWSQSTLIPKGNPPVLFFSIFSIFLRSRLGGRQRPIENSGRDENETRRDHQRTRVSTDERASWSGGGKKKRPAGVTSCASDGRTDRTGCKRSSSTAEWRGICSGRGREETTGNSRGGEVSSAAG